MWRADLNEMKDWVFVAWKNVCKPKTCGGLGIRRLNAMNSAMPGKIGWSLVQDSDKIWV